jgi:hypothetical protein
MAANLRQPEICQGAPPSAGDTQKKGRLIIQGDELWLFVDILQILRESHRCYLVFHPSLQCIITCVALPVTLTH